jgi:hypothetical protein
VALDVVHHLRWAGDGLLMRAVSQRFSVQGLSRGTSGVIYLAATEIQSSLALVAWPRINEYMIGSQPSKPHVGDLVKARAQSPHCYVFCLFEDRSSNSVPRHLSTLWQRLESPILPTRKASSHEQSRKMQQARALATDWTGWTLTMTSTTFALAPRHLPWVGARAG